VFFTREEIVARDPRQLSDLFVGISYNRLDATFGSADAQCRSALVYLDGLLIGGGTTRVNINELATPSQIEAMEVYVGIARVPTRFSGLGSGCGVVVLWTR
jgi:hypothetical protein